VERNFASYELAHKLLGYAPSIGREEGIADTWKWFCDFVFGH
jgi:nucleoside-diphosphate-sugar epimerase